MKQTKEWSLVLQSDLSQSVLNILFIGLIIANFIKDKSLYFNNIIRISTEYVNKQLFYDEYGKNG